MRHKVLIVNTFFDEYRRLGGSPWRVPRGSGHVFLAGAFNPDTVEVRLHSEQTDGYLVDRALLGWPDMVVVTGLTSALDRMLHIAACAKTLNPRVITVAGGPAVRALPVFAGRRFDHACTGDVEDLREVAIMHWGESATAAPGDLFPRLDLADRRGRIGYVESTRYCNFRCAFCSLTGEQRSYRKYGIDHIRRQIEATGKRQIIFLDNNFYGNDRSFFDARIELLADLRRRGVIDGWSALVTGDFFAREANIEAARNAGCVSLFSGVESFDADQLAAYNKKQNGVVPQVEMIRSCLDHGILFQYGIMLDPSTRSVAELEAEIDFILATPEIPLPAYFTLPIPLLGTPYFRDCRDKGLLLPNMRLREMNGVTLTLRPRDGMRETMHFVRRLVDLRGRKTRVFAHAARFSARYATRLSPLQQLAAWAVPVLTTFPGFATSPLKPRLRRPRQTFHAPSEAIDPAYTPAFQLDPAFAHHYHPTRVTDDWGGIAEGLADDLVEPLVEPVEPSLREEILQP